MIAIPCQSCHRMIDIDTRKISAKVPCYLLLCDDCQIEAKNNLREAKLKKILKKSIWSKFKDFVGV